MGEREVAARKKSNEPNGSGGGGRARGGQGRQGRMGRTGPGRIRSHHGSKPATRTTIKRKSITNRNPKRNETNTRHKTKKYASA
jgi:hypothetical protein